MNVLELEDNSSQLVEVSPQSLFGFETVMPIKGFPHRGNHVPAIDPHYQFNPKVTASILAGFALNRRVLVQGFHGTGKTSHIEQVAARLNWDTFRLNLGDHITREDLIGRDVTKIKEGKTVTEFQEGIIPWAIQRPMALILDEYDASSSELLFIMQRLLENNGKFALPNQNKVITPHDYFRIFATANTVGLGDDSGMYHGVNLLNHAQMDRWNMVASLNYLSPSEEVRTVTSRLSALTTNIDHDLVKKMVSLAGMTRQAFEQGDVSVLMSPRTVITWAENYALLGELESAFRLTFLNKTDPKDHRHYAQMYRDIFDASLDYISEYDALNTSSPAQSAADDN